MSKFCHNCGTQLDDGVRFCANCGSEQVDAPSHEQSNDYQNQYQAPNYGYQEPNHGYQTPHYDYQAPRSTAPQVYKKSNKKKKIIISIISALLVVAIIVGILFATGVIGKPKNNPEQLVEEFVTLLITEGDWVKLSEYYAPFIDEDDIEEEIGLFGIYCVALYDDVVGPGFTDFHDYTDAQCNKLNAELKKEGYTKVKIKEAKSVSVVIGYCPYGTEYYYDDLKITLVLYKNQWYILSVDVSEFYSY